MKFKNPFKEEGKWYKANLHCHTTESDGVLTPAERVEQYRAHGYSILAITDHGIVADIEGLSSEEFLVIPGIECHPMDGDITLHILALNMPYGFQVREEEDPIQLMSRISEAGGVAIMAHPYWLGQSTEELLRLKGAIGIEIFNSTCGNIGKPISSVQWDGLLDRGIKSIGLAVDDTHHDKGDVFEGWMWMKLKELTAKAVVDALEKGCFYSSTGPEIEDITIDNNRISVKCPPVRSISFIAQKFFGKRFRADKGETLTRAELELTGNEKYIRIECTDIEGGTAWSNPFFLNG